MNDHINYKKAYERQRLARQHAEDILENKSRELFEKNESLLSAYNKLKDQKAKLLHQEKLASIGQLSAGVAHEINNPTGFVKSNIKSLSEYFININQLFTLYDDVINSLDKQGILPEEYIQRVNTLKNDIEIDFIFSDTKCLINESLSGISRIEDIVKSLKNFARPNSNIKECFDLNQCIENTVKLVQNEIKYKSKLYTYFGTLPQLTGYPSEIGQVVLNLIVNALQAIKENGEITITTSYNEDKITLSIKDNGCGINEENLNNIFDPFFTTKEMDEGTGLGLSITHGIIKKHNGTIEVISEKNVMTEFIIKLPVIEKTDN